MKYKNGCFFQKSRTAHEKLREAINNGAPDSIGWLYDVLCFDEHNFTGRREDFFFRTIKDLSADSGLSQRTVIRSMRRLKNEGLINTWPMHWVDKKTGKKSEKHVTGIRILD